MKTDDQMEADLHAMIQGHYYSEDYELEWAAKNYYDELAAREKQSFENLLYRRLSSNPDLSAVTMCARLGLVALAPMLAGLLEEESATSAMSRALLQAISHIPGEAAYESVERFMDSEQEGEALLCLTRMNFGRALHHLRRAMRKGHLHNFCLHALHAHYKKVGRTVFRFDLARLVEPDPKQFKPHLKKILLSNRGAFNPFEAAELEEWIALLEMI